jgi:hypothetical protein
MSNDHTNRDGMPLNLQLAWSAYLSRFNKPVGVTTAQEELFVQQVPSAEERRQLTQTVSRSFLAAHDHFQENHKARPSLGVNGGKPAELVAG